MAYDKGNWDFDHGFVKGQKKRPMNHPKMPPFGTGGGYGCGYGGERKQSRSTDVIHVCRKGRKSRRRQLLKQDLESRISEFQSEEDETV